MPQASLTRARFGVAAASLALLAGLTLAATFLSSATAAPSKPPSKDYYGVSIAEVPLEADLERMEAGNIRSVRTPFLWDILQVRARKGRKIEKVIRWSELDPIVLMIAEHGIRLVPYVYGTSRFAARSITEPPTTRKLRKEWTMLLRALQDRYGPGGKLWAQNPDVQPQPITAWQIWNEPNSKAYWKNPRTAPEKYAKLLKISDAALNGERGGGAKIVAAGLFATPSRGMPMHKFLRRLFATKSAKAHIDTLALHPYSPNIKGVKRQLQLGRFAMREGGAGNIPLWITEIGWPSDGHPRNPYYKTPKQQAQMLRNVFDLFLERRWGISRVYWYTWRDNNVNPKCDVCRYSGLLEADGTPKPAWYRYIRYSGGESGD